MIKFTSTPSLAERREADLIAIPYFEEKKAEPAISFSGVPTDLIERVVQSGDFSGKQGELLTLYPENWPEKRIVLCGLGKPKELSEEMLRRTYAKLAALCQEKKAIQLNVCLPKATGIEVERGIAEGLLLANYQFSLKCEKRKEAERPLIQHVMLVGGTKQGLAAAKQCADIAEGVYLARDLVNGNADDIIPQELAHAAEKLAKRFPKLKVTIFDKKRIEKEKMGLLLAVNRGSSHPPVFILVEYRGDPKSKEHTVLVGKGITFDTGGLNLKSTGFIEDMKCDMGGAAAVLGIMSALASLGLKINVTGVIPSTENAISATSYKPGDVYIGYAGKSVEVGNTDAEGRLILADALAYAAKNLKPTRMIDFATLTGSVVIALGEETTGMMSNNDELAQALTSAGLKTFERVWRMPLFEEYKSQLKSEIADLKSTGGRPAGSIIAALFLQEFVGNVPWAHLDIAGTAFLDKPRRYHPQFATGVGVRLMAEFLLNL